MEDNIKRIMSDIFGVNVGDITDSASMKTIPAWDSLKHMEMITALEENFNIRLKVDDMVEMTSFRAICDILRAYGN